MIEILKFFFIYIPIGLVSLLFHYFSKIIPKKNNLILFGAWDGTQFRGNSKLLFFQMLKRKNYECFWVTRNKNLHKKLIFNKIPSLYFFSLAGIVKSLRAKFYIITHTQRDINYFLSGGANVINLMHYGFFLKVMGKKTFFHDKSLLQKIFISTKYPLQHLINCIDYVFYISDSQKKLINRAYDLPDNKLKINHGIKKDLLLSKNYMNYIFDFEKKELVKVNKNKTNILFLPTLRKKNANFYFFNNDFDYKILDAFLFKNNAEIYINLHPFDANIKNQLESYDNIKILSPINDNNNILMRHMNIFVTDYSSVYFDFLLFDKPIVLAPFDHSNYIKFDRNLINEYFNMPSEFAYNWDQLINVLENIIKHNEDKHIDERVKLKNKLFPNLNLSGLDETIKLLENIK